MGVISSIFVLALTNCIAIVTVTLLFTVYIRFYQRLVEDTELSTEHHDVHNIIKLYSVKPLLTPCSFDIGVILLPLNYTKPREVYI